MRIVLLIIIFIIIRLYQINIRKNIDKGYYIVEKMISDEDYILDLWKNKKYSDIKNFFLNNKNIRDKISKILSNDYELIDYTYIIEDSAIHTFHRDYTSSKNYNNLENPSYTMILYLDNSDTGLNIIPGSHKDNIPIYFKDFTQTLNFKPGTAIIFDADILHAGTATEVNAKRHCIQFKIIHKNDIKKLPHLLNYHVLINRPNSKSTFTKNIESSFTMYFPFVMDFFQNHIKSSFTEQKTPFQLFISSIIFSDDKFFKPIRV